MSISQAKDVYDRLVGASGYDPRTIYQEPHGTPGGIVEIARLAEQRQAAMDPRNLRLGAAAIDQISTEVVQPDGQDQANV